MEGDQAAAAHAKKSRIWTTKRDSTRDTERGVLRRLCEASASCLPVLGTANLFLTAWDALTLLVLAYLAVGLPLVVGWHPVAWSALTPLHVCIDTIFVLDVLLSFRRGYWHDGMAVHDPYRVAMRYVRSDLRYDALAAVPYLTIAHSLSSTADGGMALGGTLLMMLEEVRVVLRLLRSRKDSGRGQAHRNPVVRRLAELLLLLLFMCHWIGSMWWAVSASELLQAPLDFVTAAQEPNASTPGAPGGTTFMPQGSWHPTEQVLGQSWALQWAHAFVWGASIVTGFVLYDVRPTTAPELVVTVIAMVMGLAMNTVIISTTTSLLQAIDSRNAFGRQRLESIGKYLEFKNVRPELSAKIVAFFAYKLTSSTVSLKGVDFHELPNDLATHLTLELHKSLLKKCFIFSALPPRFLVPLLRKLEPMVAVPGEVVVREGHVNEKLFFIHRGTVQIFRAFGPDSMKRQMLLTTLEDSDFFGEASLMPDTSSGGDGTSSPTSGGFNKAGKANATIVCYSYCEFLTLSFVHVAGLSHLMGAKADVFKSALNEGVQHRAKRASSTRRTSTCTRRSSGAGVSLMRRGTVTSVDIDQVKRRDSAGAPGACASLFKRRNLSLDSANPVSSLPPALASQGGNEVAMTKRVRSVSFDDQTGAAGLLEAVGAAAKSFESESSKTSSLVSPARVAPSPSPSQLHTSATPANDET